jgi:predicted nucleic acid-binding protein
MSVPRFIDTNILLYSISTAADEAHKRDRARAVLEADDCCLSVQVLQEFYVQATRATRRNPLSHATAVGLVDAWTRFQVQNTTVPLVRLALEIADTNRFPYWDCAVIAAAAMLGCPELLTEDMAHGREVAGVLIVNPFR